MNDWGADGGGDPVCGVIGSIHLDWVFQRCETSRSQYAYLFFSRESITSDPGQFQESASYTKYLVTTKLKALATCVIILNYRVACLIKSHVDFSVGWVHFDITTGEAVSLA